jgi:hypothetical protein
MNKNVLISEIVADVVERNRNGAQGVSELSYFVEALAQKYTDRNILTQKLQDLLDENTIN